jgi:hypothetical protein
LDALIVKKTELINKRLTSIEEKIKEHNEQQENVLKQAVYLEVDKKMDSLQEKDYFQRFDSKEKATFINQVIINIEKKKNELIYQNES